MKDYYSILGITDEEKNLNDKEFQKVCKKKYREAALKYHPDKWANASEEERKNAEEKFKEISEANEILSNPKKRAQYNNGGSDINMDGFDPFEHFKDMFGGMGGFGSFFNMGGRGNQQKRGSDIQAEINITLEEAYKGGYKNIKITKTCQCAKCNGTGSEDGKSHTCPHCNGQGVTTQMIQHGPGMFQMRQQPCEYCKGTGNLIDKKCKACNGSGTEYKSENENVNLPKGMSDGMILNISGKGNAIKDGIPGDLHVFVHVKNDPYFVRPDSINLIHYEEVPFNECLLGFKKEFKCIDGSKVTVDAPELTPHGKSFIFKGKGMPNPNNEYQVGDYAVVINYKLPNKLTDKQKEALKDIYG